MTLKGNVTNSKVWQRGLFILIYCLILYFAFILVWLLAVFQFISKLLTGDVNRQLADFNAGLLRNISRILCYITFEADEGPFFTFNQYTYTPRDDSVEERLKAIVIEQLGLNEEDVTSEASFEDDLGADSLDLIELVMAVEEEFEIGISDEDAAKITTIKEAILLIKQFLGLRPEVNMKQGHTVSGYTEEMEIDLVKEYQSANTDGERARALVILASRYGRTPASVRSKLIRMGVINRPKIKM